MKRLEGKKALVTGASEGIGRAIALELAREGCQVRGVARGLSRLEDLARELGPLALPPIAADLSEEAGIVKISTELQSGGYDVLVNNAGYSVYGKFFEVPLQKSQGVTRVNIDSLVALSHAFLARAKSGAALVNVASTLSYMTMAKQGVYCATKHFVRSFSDSLWYEQRPRGIYVQCLCPGATTTLFSERAGGDANEAPGAISQTADQVARLCVAEIVRRKNPVVVSGWINRLMVTLTRILPERRVVEILGRLK